MKPVGWFSSSMTTESMIKTYMDTLTMNKQWIEASHYHARLYQGSSGEERHYVYEYLDVMGLFETGWMIYDFDKYNREQNKFGYPK